MTSQNSKYCSWFCGLNFSSNNSYNDNFSYMGWHNNYDLVKLNLKNNFVKEHLFNAVKMWIEEFDIDGLRMDAADCMDMQFLQELSRYTKSINPNFFIFGEVVHGDYRRYVLEGELDSVTNYECYKGLFSSHNDINLFEIAYSLNRQFAWNGIYKNLPLYNFVDNHDVTRISSIIKKEEYIYTIYGLLFTMPGIPSIYYGSEFGIKGIKLDKSDLELRPSIKNINNSPAKNNDLANIISRLAHIRKTNSSLKNGSYLQVYLNHSQFAFLRENEEELILVVVNISNQNFSININYNFGRIIEFSDLLNKNEILYSTQNSLYIENLYPNWLRILRTPK
ncbi:MAG TPA: alpha-amylase family glycosyl hydrolase [Melioribacteraceae bacterium]|nr:alpha-amylase family glycosyl hydrolase [Melioribacteraceae bacterium]